MEVTLNNHKNEMQKCKNKDEKSKLLKLSSPAGNWTPVSRVTGGDTNHYTTEDLLQWCNLKKDNGKILAFLAFDGLSSRKR